MEGAANSADADSNNQAVPAVPVGANIAEPAEPHTYHTLDDSDEKQKMLPVKQDDEPVQGGGVGGAPICIPDNQKVNGDAKLDIGEVKTAFVGLTKEELLKYANDPFWVRLRWFLFITFWALWLAMLLGAIMIIYGAPKCEPPPPKTWWEEGPLAQVNSLHVQADDVQRLKTMGVRGVIADFSGSDAYQPFESDHPFIEIIKMVKLAGLEMVVGLDPSASNYFFKTDVDDGRIMDNYFIWAKGSDANGGPPNNWINRQNISVWKYYADRKQYYYAPNGAPHLNFSYSNVSMEFEKVLRRFMEFGATGFMLRNVTNLVVNDTFEDAVVNKEHLPETVKLLADWRRIVKNYTNNGPFMVADELPDLYKYTLDGLLVVDLPIERRLFTFEESPKGNGMVDGRTVAQHLAYGLERLFANRTVWPAIEYESNEIFDMISFLMPATPLVHENFKLMHKELLTMRKNPSVVRGNITYSALSNNTVFVCTRVASGSPGILLAWNPTNEPATVNFATDISNVADEVTVQFFSANYNESAILMNGKLSAHQFPVSPNSAIVLSYVPRKDNE